MKICIINIFRNYYINIINSIINYPGDIYNILNILEELRITNYNDFKKNNEV